jgi:hypothetical protein
LEGYSSLECALHRAEVLGIDAKEINAKLREFVNRTTGTPAPRPS